MAVASAAGVGGARTLYPERRGSPGHRRPKLLHGFHHKAEMVQEGVDGDAQEPRLSRPPAPAGHRNVTEPGPRPPVRPRTLSPPSPAPGGVTHTCSKFSTTVSSLLTSAFRGSGSGLRAPWAIRAFSGEGNGTLSVLGPS